MFQNDFNYKKFFLLCLRNWKLFVASVFICALLGFVYVKWATPIYRVYANILIKTDGGGMGAMLSSAMPGGLGSSLGLGSNSVDDELQVISSHTLAKKVIKNLGIQTTYTELDWLKNKDHYNTSPIIVTADSALLDTLSVPLSIKIKLEKDGKGIVSCVVDKIKMRDLTIDKFPFKIPTPIGEFTLLTTDQFKSNGEPLEMKMSISSLDYCAEQIFKVLSISIANKKANLISMSYIDSNKKRAKDILNNLMELYNLDAVKDKQLTSTSTAQFIDERLSRITSELHEIETNIQLYKQDNLIVDPKVEVEATLGQNGEFMSKLVDVETKLSVVEMLESYMLSPKNSFELIPSSLAFEDKAAGDAIQKYNLLLLDRNQIKAYGSTSNPVLINLERNIESTRGSILHSIQDNKKALSIARADLKRVEKRFMDRFKEMPRQEKEFIDIKRQQIIKGELYAFLLEKREEANIALAVAEPKAKVIDPAYTQTRKHSPRGLIVLFMCCVGGFMMVLVYLWVKEYLKVHFEDKSELQELTSLPILGEVCWSSEANSVVVRDGQTSSVAELFRLIRNNIKFYLNSADEKVIMVTSTVSGEGKSFISTNLASSLSILNHRVVVVGMDIRNPQLQAYFPHVSSKVGLTEYLSQEQKRPSDIILPTGVHANLDVIFAGPVPPNPSELLLSNRLELLFKYLKEHYDYIIIDSAPVGMVSDSFSIDRVSDATIYVCRANYTTKDNIRFAEEVIGNKQLKKASLVINGVTTKKGYGYGYGQASGK